MAERHRPTGFTVQTAFYEAGGVYGDVYGDWVVIKVAPALNNVLPGKTPLEVEQFCIKKGFLYTEKN